MEEKYCVYKHISPSGKVYVGQTCLNVNRRWRNGRGYKTQIFFRAIEKYGWDNFEHEVVYDNLTKDEADFYERYLIKKYKSNNKKYGYNVENGGCKGKRPSEETIELPVW